MFPKVRLYTMGCVMFSILALVLEQTSGVEIVNCGPNKPLVEKKYARYFEIECVNIHEGFEVFWYLNTKKGDIVAAHCVQKNNCSFPTRFVSNKSNSNRILLNVASFVKYFGFTGITCSERNPSGVGESSYTCGVQLKPRKILWRRHQE